MLVKPEALQEFKKLYAEEFGEELSDDKARELASNLLELYLLLMQPTPKEQEATEEPRS